MRRIAMLPLLAIVLMPLPARAQDDAGMEKPTEIASVIRAKRPYGVGTYTYYMMTVYQAALWTDEPNWSMQAPFAFSQKYDVDVPKGTIVDRTAAEMQRIAATDEDHTQAYRAALGKLYTDIRNGDTVTSLFVPGKKLTLYHNGVATGTTSDMDFARHYLDLWFSDKTSATDLQRELLRQSSN